MMARSANQTLMEWLQGQGYSACCYVPSERPDRFVTVERTGGGAGDLIDHPTVTLQFWALTHAQAEEDALAVRDLILRGARPEGFGAISINAGPYEFDDPDSRQKRFQMVLDCTMNI
jgi:hypothetical protein